MNCGWHGTPGGSGTCEYGYSTCPAGYTQWYYDYACSNNSCTPPPACLVTTSPVAYNFTLGGTVTGQITATVTGLAGRTITQMRFGAYDTSIATVNPASSGLPYATTVTAATAGKTAVWATADLNDSTTCETTGASDTDINVAANGGGGRLPPG